MIVAPVSVRDPEAVRDALLSHGWEGDLASLTSGGLELSAFHITGVPTATLEAMVPLSARLGLELVTGDDWLLLVGPRARLGAFARPWVQPEPVQELAQAVGMAMPGDKPSAFCHASGEVDLAQPVIVAVLNATPDSFSPSSRVTAPDAAVEAVAGFLEGGASVIDIGGQSTRPGAGILDPNEEQGRVLPVIEAVAKEHPGVAISVDTINSETARLAVSAGAVIVNDVTAGRHDPALLDAVAESSAGLILSHSRGPVGTLADYDHANYLGDVTGAVVAELQQSLMVAQKAGVQSKRIALDPGFGFGKKPQQNWRLLAQLDALVSIGQPVLVGVSRKRFLSEASTDSDGDLDRATAAACAIARDRGATMFRVHNPAAVREALAVADEVAR